MDEQEKLPENEIEPAGDEELKEDVLEAEDIDELEDDLADEDMDTPQVEQYIGAYPITDDAMDIDAALAAISQLDFLTQADEEVLDDYPESDEEEAEYSEIQPFTRADVVYGDFAQPEALRMVRGQLASVVPALVLITLGGWLTFTLTTASQMPSMSDILPVILIAGGGIFLSQWLTSKGWTRGSFFLGLLLVLIGAIQLFVSQSSALTMQSVWTFWLGAIGISLFATGYLSYPRLPRMSIMGILVIIAGGIAYVLSAGMLDASFINSLSNFWIIAVLVLIFLVFAPLIRRRQ